MKSGTQTRGYNAKIKSNSKKREERKDKKEQTKPYIMIETIEIVNDIRIHLGLTSIGETARRIILAAFEDWKAIDQLQPFLRWDYIREDHRFIGHPDRKDIAEIVPKNERTKRLPIRFTKQDVERMEVFHSCLSCPFAYMVGSLLYVGIQSERVIERIAPGYMMKSIYSFRRRVWG